MSKKLPVNGFKWIDFWKEFLKIYNYCTRDPYSFMMVDTRPTARILDILDLLILDQSR